MRSRCAKIWYDELEFLRLIPGCALLPTQLYDPSQACGKPGSIKTKISQPPNFLGLSCHLINDIPDLSKIETGANKVETEAR